jgi:hypothetical protein
MLLRWRGSHWNRKLSAHVRRWKGHSRRIGALWSFVGLGWCRGLGGGSLDDGGERRGNETHEEDLEDGVGELRSLL